MSSLIPVAVYGLEVPCGDVLTPAVTDIRNTFRVTMAAIDPSAPVASGEEVPRATLKIIRRHIGGGEGSDSDEEEYLKGLLAGQASDDDDEDSDSDGWEDELETNGGPSDLSKSKKVRNEKALAELKKSLEEDDDMDVDDGAPNGVNGLLSKFGKKGKAKASAEEDLSSDEEGEGGFAAEEFVLCTLDPTKTYQQPLDLSIGEDEEVMFKVTGTHTVYLTGNYVIPPPGGDSPYDSDEDDYDLPPDEDELDDEEESDELDDMEDPRVTELGSDEDSIPKLVNAKVNVDKKGKNKRAAEESAEEPAGLDDIMAKSLKPAEATTNGEQKLSKKQLKKLKNNDGRAVAAATDAKSTKKDDKDTQSTSASLKGDKKVQFAKNLEQGPAPSKDAKVEQKDGKKDEKKDEKKKDDAPKSTLGVKNIGGVTVDDKKLGTGPAAKKGNKVAMRYIGKLQSNNFQFDANKKGDPFSFKLGSGEVIKGWDIGVAGMSVGGERRITIPANLAYGKKGAGQIPSNSTLVFDVKLLSLK